MIKTYRFSDLIVVLNIKNGKIAFFDGSVKEINTNLIPNFFTYDILHFSQKDYSTFYLGFNISRTCNLHCTYCFSNRSNNSTIDSDFIEDAINNFISSVPTCKKLFIDLSGTGEPLLQSKMIGRIADICIKLGVVSHVIYTRLRQIK